MQAKGPLRVRIANRRGGGLWWRVPAALVIWAVLVAPLLVLALAVGLLRHYAADLPVAPDLDAWEQSAPRTSVICWSLTGSR